MRILYFSLLSLFLLTSCAKTVHVASTEVTGVRMTQESAEADAELADFIEPYKEKLDKEMNQVIGVCANHLQKGKPESPMCNLVADIVQKQATERSGRDIDFSVQNYGGIRVGSIPKGEITVGRVFELMPFDNLIAIMEMPGMWVDTIVNRFARSGGWPVSKELNFEITEKRKAINIKIDGQALDYDKTYLIAMPDYIASGGDRMFFLQDLERVDLDYLVRDAIIDYIKDQTAAGNQIDATTDGRIVRH